MQSRVADVLILSSSFIKNIGLLNGKMGIAIYFFHWYKFTNDEIYQKFAEELIDEIFEEVTSNTLMNFENGLAGIGWGIEYLIKKEYLEGDSNVILEDIDFFVLNNVLDNMEKIASLDEVIGYGIYFLCRLKKQKESLQKDNVVDFEKGLTSIIVKLEFFLNRIQINKDYFNSSQNINEFCILMYFLFLLKNRSYAPHCIAELIRGMLNKLLEEAFNQDCEMLKLIICAVNEYYNLNEFELPDCFLNNSFDIVSNINKDNLIEEVAKEQEHILTKILFVELLYYLAYRKSHNKHVFSVLEFWVDYYFKVSDDINSKMNFKAATVDLGLKAGLAGLGLLHLFVNEIILQSKDVCGDNLLRKIL